MADLLTDEKAREEFKAEQVTDIYGVKVPDAWVGAGALDEFKDGRGEGDDDSK